VLIGSSALTASAAFLAACGGDEDDTASTGSNGSTGVSSGSSSSGGSTGSSSGSSGASAGLLTKPVDTTAKAVRGGILKERQYREPSTLDIFAANSPLNSLIIPTYSTFVQQRRGHMEPSDGELIGDIAESWETSPDGLTVTLKLRQGVKWHNKAPVNGRAFDMDDALFTWSRYVAKSTGAQTVANERNPDAPILSFEASDPSTITLKLTEPLSYAVGLLSNAGSLSGSLAIIPKETDSTFDIKGDIIGTGPYMLQEYEPSVGFKMVRHEEYYDKDRTLLDGIDLPIITEYATALAQLKTGNLYSMGSYGPSGSVNPEDLLNVKQEQPELQIYASDYKLGSSGVNSEVMFGWLPEGNLFYDERVRQALSMAIDRDLIIDTFNNVKTFNDAGLPVDTRWSSALQPTRDETTGWWLDPKSSDFGPNAKYYHYNLEEAKKLLSAAGYPNGFDIISHQLTTNERGEEVVKHAEVQNGLMAELGINITVDPIDYAKQYGPLYRDGRGQFEGWAYASASGGATGGTSIGLLANEFWSKSGSSYRGFSTSGKNDESGDPEVDSMIAKGRLEMDTEKRRAIVFDLQRYLAEKQYTILAPGAASTFVTVWPCISNFKTYQRVNYTADQVWIDETKPPFKS
jgi:peptide/nickel transport system substrate-binding protein